MVGILKLIGSPDLPLNLDSSHGLLLKLFNRFLFLKTCSMAATSQSTGSAMPMVALVLIKDNISIANTILLQMYKFIAGNFEMETQVELHVKLPCSENKTSDFVLFVYLTQVISYLVLYGMQNLQKDDVSRLTKQCV